MNPKHLDHAVKTGLISAVLIGLSIGTFYGLTYSAQISVVLIDSIDIYGDPTAVRFDTGSPMIASVVAIIPSIIGGVAGAGAPFGVVILAECLKLSQTAQLVTRFVFAIGGGGAAGTIITVIVPQFATEGAALGAGVGTVTGIVALSSYRLQTKLGAAPGRLCWVHHQFNLQAVQVHTGGLGLDDCVRFGGAWRLGNCHNQA